MKRLFFLFVLISSFANAQQAKTLQFIEEIHDFGYITQEKGAAVYQFDFTNLTNRPVKILNVQASCGCTTPDWSRDAILPGKTGYVQASFDPKGRPGFFNKSLTVTTDFDSNPLMLQIKGNVATTGSGINDPEFRAESGSWRLLVSTFNMGKVFVKDEYMMKEFPILNAGTKPITFLKSESPDYIRVDVLPVVLQPGEKGKVRVSYNGKIKNQYGFHSDNVAIHTDDEATPIKNYSVYVTLEEYFPTLTAEQLAAAPRLRISNTSFDMGKMRQHNAASKELYLYNTGSKELAIREIQSNCSCVNTLADKMILKPGDSTTLKVKFNPQNRQGTQQKRLTIYTNDPVNPVQAVTFTAYVD